MSENSPDNSRQERSRFWESASGFWRGLSAWRVWLLCASLIAIVVLQLYVQFRFNYWNRDFFNALEERDPVRLRAQALLLIPLCVASVALAAASVWGRMTVQRKWREWLTICLIDYWVDDDRYVHLAEVEGEQKIPEYRRGCQDRDRRTGRFCARTGLLATDRHHLHPDSVECRRRRQFFAVRLQALDSGLSGRQRRGLFRHRYIGDAAGRLAVDQGHPDQGPGRGGADHGGAPASRNRRGTHSETAGGGVQAGALAGAAEYDGATGDGCAGS